MKLTPLSSAALHSSQRVLSEPSSGRPSVTPSLRRWASQPSEASPGAACQRRPSSASRGFLGSPPPPPQETPQPLHRLDRDLPPEPVERQPSGEVARRLAL